MRKVMHLNKMVEAAGIESARKKRKSAKSQGSSS
jgi:hypothetical protein